MKPFDIKKNTKCVLCEEAIGGLYHLCKINKYKKFTKTTKSTYDSNQIMAIYIQEKAKCLFRKSYHNNIDYPIESFNYCNEIFKILQKTREYLGFEMSEDNKGKTIIDLKDFYNKHLLQENITYFKFHRILFHLNLLKNQNNLELYDLIYADDIKDLFEHYLQKNVQTFSQI